MFDGIKVTKEIREDVRHRLLPAAMSFSMTVNGYAFEDEIDCLDRVCVEGELSGTDIIGVYRLICVSGSDPGSDAGRNIGNDPGNDAGIYTSSDRGRDAGHIECSYITLPAADLMDEVRDCLEGAGMDDITVRMSKWKKNGSDDEIFARTRWDISFDFELHGNSDLSSAFESVYDRMCLVTDVCQTLYLRYESANKLRSRYVDFIGFNSDGILEYDDTACFRFCPPLFGPKIYHRKVIDGMNAVTHKYSAFGCDITSTDVMVQKVKSADPATGIHCVTTLDDDFPVDPEEYEYEQSFSISKPAGCCRYFTHGDDIIAQLQYIQSGIYSIRTLDIYMAGSMWNDIANGRQNNDSYVAAVKDSDGIFRFFAKRPVEGEEEPSERGEPDAYIFRMVAYAGIETEAENAGPNTGTESDDYTGADQAGITGTEQADTEYTLGIAHKYERLLPIIAAVESWAFEPESGSNCVSAESNVSCDEAGEHSEENRLCQLNEDTHRAMAIVRKWMDGRTELGRIKSNYEWQDESYDVPNDDPYNEYPMDAGIVIDSFFGNPAYGVLALLRDERPDLFDIFRNGTDSSFTEDIHFIELTKSRAYGLDTDHGLKEIQRVKSSLRQIRITDLL